MFQMRDSGEVYLVDLGSRNGSLLNGQRVVAPALLADGDRLVLGRVRVEFYSPDSPAKPQLRHVDVEEMATEADAMAAPTSREKRLISVAVVDIRGYTVLSRTLDAPHAFGSHRRVSHARQAEQILRRHGSWGGKSTGDGQMAIWPASTTMLTPADRVAAKSCPKT